MVRCGCDQVRRPAYHRGFAGQNTLGVRNSMRELPTSVRPFIRLAKNFAFQDVVSRQENLAVRNAEQIVTRFGGQKVGTTGEGRDLAASDVRFYSALFTEDDEEALPWRGKVGPLAAFAASHNEHMICLVGTAGAFYVFTVPDGKLYEVGATFGEAMERLLLGLSYGPALQPDASYLDSASSTTVNNAGVDQAGRDDAGEA